MAINETLPTLEELRKMIEVFDRDLIQTIAQRFEVAKIIGEVKKRGGKVVEDKKREEELCALHATWADEFGADVKLITNIFILVMVESKKTQADSVNS